MSAKQLIGGAPAVSDQFEQTAFIHWYENSEWAKLPVWRDPLWFGWVARTKFDQSMASPRDETLLARRQLDAMLVQMLTSDGPAQLDYIQANAGDLLNLVGHIKKLEGGPR